MNTTLQPNYSKILSKLELSRDARVISCQELNFMHDGKPILKVYFQKNKNMKNVWNELIRLSEHQNNS